MDKTLIKLNAIKETYQEAGYPILIKMIDQIIEEVEYKNTVLDDYLAEIKSLSEVLEPPMFEGTKEALDNLRIIGDKDSG